MKTLTRAFVLTIWILAISYAAPAQTTTTCHRNGDDVECTSVDMTPQPGSDYRQGTYGPIYDPALAAQHAFERGLAQAQQVTNARQVITEPAEPTVNRRSVKKFCKRNGDGARWSQTRGVEVFTGVCGQ